MVSPQINPTHLLPSLMLLPSHQFQKSFQLPTPIRYELILVRIGRRVPTFLLQPSASVPDLPQALSTSRDPSRPSQPSSSFFDFHRPLISPDSIDFFSRLLRPCMDFSDLARAYLNSFYLLRPFMIFESARFGESTSFDGSASAHGRSISLLCAP
jgi:hypothetical protein